MKATLVVVPVMILVVVAGFVIGGGAGGTVGTIVATGAVLLAARLAMPRERRADPRDPPPRDESFPRYRELSSMLSWSRRSDRYFNAVLRPVLADATAAELLRRNRIDMGREPAEAARMVGEAVWALVDPSVPLDTPVGATPEKIDAVLDALEGS